MGLGLGRYFEKQRENLQRERELDELKRRNDIEVAKLKVLQQESPFGEI